MKAPCMSKEQNKQGIHDLVNDQGFEMHYRAISNIIWKFSDVRESTCVQQSKRMDNDLFSYVECFSN